MIQKKALSFLIFAIGCTVQSSWAAEHPWFDEGMAREARIETLMEAMTVEEKMQQLLADAPGIPRLGIPPYDWWNEALHGVARNGRATVFPQPIGLAATFDEALIRRLAEAISDEARVKYKLAQGIGNYSRYAGLTFWSPNVNLFRDPRWGRGMETWGEDPYLTARMGAAFVKGLQGDDPDYMQAAACAKHFAVHSGPEAVRHEFDAVAPLKDFHESYLPAFEALVTDAKVECVMCAYNRIYGEPACGSELLLQDTLREKWGFEGHVVSDCGAIEDFYKYHKVAEDAATSAAWALKAGTDINCGSNYEALPESLAKGLISELDIDRALGRLLSTRMKLGMFDTDSEKPWDALGEETVESESHVALARKSAQRSIVLLKNSNGTLPLKKNIRTLYVTGPNASSSEVLLGNYYGLSRDTVTILDGIMGKVHIGTSVQYKYGVLPFRDNVNPLDWATGIAASSEATVAVLGISGLLEGEEGASLASGTKGDRLELGLPESQLAYLRKLRKAGNKPLIVVLTGGSPMTIPEVDELADAIVWAWYPGQQGGNAVADVIFGDANPAGRLPITFPKSVDQLPPYEDYSMQGRTYRYMTDEPLYPFGFGLSYTEFEYGDVKLSSTDLTEDSPLEVKITVKNSGEMDGHEVVQLYFSSDSVGKGAPISSLVGFRSVFIEAGREATVEFTIEPEQMMLFDESGQRQFVEGTYTVHAGGVSPGNRGEALTGSKLRTARVKLH